ncbi:MAG: sulfotransferase family protein [Pseudomonadota bacterium]|nr:sulfotransferase family protein [Pseudomonadota bacterium]
MVNRSPSRLGEAPASLDRRLIFTPDRTALYVSVPKTGCTTIKTVMGGATGLLDPESQDYRFSNPSIHNTWKDREIKWGDLAKRDRALMLAGGATFRFTSVRNPFERAVSCYLDRIVNHRRDSYLGQSFGEGGDVSLLMFLRVVAAQTPLERDIHCRAMSDLTFSDRLIYDDIVRYETFDADLRRVMGRLGLEDAAIPAPRPSDITHAKQRLGELLGGEECDLIREIYASDFATFGYPARPSLDGD